MRRTLLVAVIATLTMALAASAAYAKPVKVEVLSSKPHIVSGGDALISVTSKDEPLSSLTIRRNGVDVTDSFSEQDGALVGLVDRLRPRKNEITVTQGNSARVLGA